MKVLYHIYVGFPIFIRLWRIKRLATQPSLPISQLYQNLTRIAFYFFQYFL
jgi:hypothetical protein